MALGELQISWVGSDEGDILVTDEFDIPVVLDDSVAQESEVPTEALVEEISTENETEEEDNV
jgi:segregation and condensation protein A